MAFGAVKGNFLHWIFRKISYKIKDVANAI